MSVILRDYQREAIEAFHAARAEGLEKRFLLTAAVGAGKTIVAASLISHEVRHRDNARCLFICHRDELIRQTVDKAGMVDDSLRVGVVQGDRDEWEGFDVVVASVQTLSRRHRLQRIPRDYFRLVIVDETHRVTAASYLSVLRHFGCYDDASATALLGITATANRTDGVDLGTVYQRHVYDIGLLDLIQQGALVPIRAVSVETGTNLSGVKKRIGDFAENELASVLNTSNRNDLIAEAIRTYASERKSLVFAVNVKHAEDLAETMRKHGIRTEAVHGGIAIERRREVLADFSAGRLQALTTVQLLTEGYDEPSVNAVVWATKTLSHIKYVQGIGRGTRLSPETGKTDLLVIDFADTCSKHSLMSVPCIFGLGEVGEKALADGGDVIEAQELDAKARRDAEERRKREQAEQERIAGARLSVREVDLFAHAKIQPHLNSSDFRWLTVVQGRRYFVPLMDEQTHVWEDPDQAGVWHAGVYDSKGGITFRQLLGTGNAQDALGYAEKYLNRVGRWIIAHYRKKERERPSERQIAVLGRWGQAPRNALIAWETISLGATRRHFTAA